MAVEDTLDFERIVLHRPESADNIIQHILPYAFAVPHCIGKSVVDICCGTGYGTKLLAEAAKVVMGLDYSVIAIQHAIDKGAPYNTSFVVSDVEQENLPKADVYTCFQGLEHLEDPKLIAEQVYAVKGTCIFAVPKGGLDNPFHHHNVTEELIKSWFYAFNCKIMYMVDRQGIFEYEPGQFHNYFVIATPK